MVSGHQRCKELSLVEEITAMAGRLVPNLAIRPVVETVIQAMQALPADMPAVFRNAYKVTNHPGTPEQVRNTQMGSILAGLLDCALSAGHMAVRRCGQWRTHASVCRCICTYIVHSLCIHTSTIHAHTLRPQDRPLMYTL